MEGGEPRRESLVDTYITVPERSALPIALVRSNPSLIPPINTLFRGSLPPTTWAV